MGAGEAWKKEREARGMTLDEAAGALRVSRKYLQGIEDGDYEGWPERVFSSGYIRAYGKLLAQDPEPVLTEYFRHIEQQSSRGPELQVKPEWLERERQKGNRRINYAMAAAVVLVVGLALAWYGRRMATQPVPAPQVRTVPPPARTSPPADNAAAKAPGNGPDNAAAAGSDGTPAADNVRKPPGEAPSPSGSVASVGGAGPVNAPYQLFLEAGEMTWLMYTLDDGQPVDVMLYPGDKISIQARKRIVMKLGNAGGVAGTLNGKLLPPFGGRGQVREFRIGD